MSVAACAEIVRLGDPDRFLATMAAPRAKRGPLFAIYAFNVEVTRAAWASDEPMVCEMRLQFWRDVLGEISAGRTPAGHAVAEPLARDVDRGSLKYLQRIIDARGWDVQAHGFDGAGQFNAYLKDTYGGLMCAAARATGATEDVEIIGEVGQVCGLANWFRAVPELVARGRKPLPDVDDAAVAGLAKEGLKRLILARASLPRGAQYATRAGWLADRTLRTVAANPAAVLGGRLHMSEYTRRSSLLWRVMFSRR